MRITITKPSTGVAYFPGLAKPVVLDSATLTQADAAELEKLIAAAEISRLSTEERSAPAAPAGAADFKQDIVTVEREGKRHTLQLSDLQAKTPAMRALMRFVEVKGRR